MSYRALVFGATCFASYRAEGPFRSWADRIVARATFAWLDRRKALEQRVPPVAEADPEAQYVSQPDEYLRRRQLVADSTSYRSSSARARPTTTCSTERPEIAKELETPAETVRSRLRLWSPYACRRPLATPRALRRLS